MRFLNTTVILVAMITSSQAVTITHYGRIIGSQCTGTSAVTCTNIAAGVCCNTPGTPQIFSSLFNGLPLPAGQGIVYQTGPQCGGTSCNAGSGLDLCLSCGSTVITGAEWINPSSKRDTSTTCVNPDHAQIDSHWFNVYSDVPDDASGQLVDLAQAGNATYADVPQDLLQYEDLEYNG